jgi:heme-degrading monooxygenase HmoA
MIMRIWRTRVRTGRDAEYEHFASTRSLPMFRRRAGCLGVLLARDSDERIVVTMWDGPNAVAQLEESADYRQTAAELYNSDILQDNQTIHVYRITDGFLDPQMRWLGSPIT